MKEKSTEATHVLVADNNSIFRAGIRSLLDGNNLSIKIVGEADSGAEIMDLIEQRQPDVVLLDSCIARGAGEFDLLEEICSGEDSPNVIVMTPESDITPIIQSLSSGAVGVVTKDVTATELKQVVQRAAQKQRALSQTIVNVLVDYLLKREISPLSCDLTAIQSLTDRELEVFNHMAQGLANKEIAEHLSLSVGTVKSHISNIMGKLPVNNRAQLALLAASQLSQDQNNAKDEFD